MCKPIVAQAKPYLVKLEAGRAYFWCACGRSRTQPFCDGSHAGTDFKPVRFRATEDGEVVLCGCKHTRKPPFCDGTHNSLSATYTAADADEIEATASIALTPSEHGTWGKAVLDGGAYVCTPRVPAVALSAYIEPVIHATDGARFLSAFYGQITGGATEVLEFPGSHVVLFVRSGSGTVTISGASLP